MSKKQGRPTKKNEQIVHKMIELFKIGKTEDEVAEILRIHVNTIYNWKIKNPEFMWSVNEAKKVADDMVEAALFTRAVGFRHKSVKVFNYMGQSFEHEFTEEIEPDTQAAIFWLKNRKPEQWRDRQEIESNNKNTNTNFNYDSMTDEQIDKKIEELNGKRSN